MDDPNLRTEFRRALDVVAPPAPWLGAAIREVIRSRRHERWIDRARRRPARTRYVAFGLTMAVFAGLVVAALLLTQLHASVPPSIPGGRSSPPPSPTPTPTLTAAEQTQLAQLEARPLTFPPMPANGRCPDGPKTTIKPYADGTIPLVWGNRNVFVEGGNARLTPQNAYFDVTFYTAPTVTGVVLIRGEQLGGRLKVVYVGDYAAGPVIGTDAIAGTPVQQHPEAALPADRPPANAGAAKGWGIWKIQQGIARSYIGCTGFQFDTASGSEVIVAYDPGASSLRPTP